MPYIDVIQHEQSEGRLREIYDNLIETRGKLAEIHKIQSLNPESIVNHMDLYLTIMFGKSPLRRQQREMIAVVVSATNDCEYCINHHAEALNHFWKDDSRIERFIRSFKDAGLSKTDLALCEYAHDLTAKPSSINKDLHVAKLNKLGIEERAFLDAALVVAYFNFVNRMVLGLGVQLEEEGGEGYNYD